MQVLVEGHHEEMKLIFDNQKAEIHRLAGIIGDLNKSLTGNGKPGYATRLDRLEQDKKLRDRQTKFMWSLIGAIFIGLAINIVIPLIKT